MFFGEVHASWTWGGYAAPLRGLLGRGPTYLGLCQKTRRWKISVRHFVNHAYIHLKHCQFPVFGGDSWNHSNTQICTFWYFYACFWNYSNTHLDVFSMFCGDFWNHDKIQVLFPFFIRIHGYYIAFYIHLSTIKTSYMSYWRSNY